MHRLWSGDMAPIIVMIVTMMSLQLVNATPARDSFIGVFDPVMTVNGVSTCVAGGACCCSTGPITLTAANSPAGNTFSAQGTTDGGNACFGLPVMSGVFTVSNSSYAVNYVVALSKTVVMTQSDAGDYVSLIAGDCVTKAIRRGWVDPLASSTGRDSPSTGGDRSTGAAQSGDGVLVFVPALPSTSDETVTPQYLQRDMRSIGFNVYALDVVINATEHPQAMQWVILRAQSPDQIFSAQMYPYSAYKFEYKPLIIGPGQSLIYSLTFKEITSNNQYDSPIYTFSVPALPVSSTGGVSSTGVSSSSSSTGVSSTATYQSSSSGIDLSWIDERTFPWLGSYAADGTCVPSDTCCCSTGTIVISPVMKRDDITLPARFQIVGATDGGTACAGRTELSGLFELSGVANTATYTINGLTFTATLSAPSQPTGATIGSLGTQLGIVSNIYPNCPSTAFKTINFVPTTPPIESSSTAMVDSSTGVYPPGNYATLMAGRFDFDGKCVPTRTCCCGQGPLMITNNASSTTGSSAPTSGVLVANPLGAISVSSAFDAGAGCFGYTNIVAVFTIDTPTTAIYEAAGIRFTLSYGNNYTEVTISDTFHECTSFARRSPPARNAATPIEGSLMTPLLALMGTIIALYATRRFLA